MNNFNVSVVLPIKSSVVKDFDTYFEKAITSLKSQVVGINELVIVHTNETQLVEKLESFDFGDLNVVKVLFEGTPSLFKNVKKYVDAYGEEVDAYLPIVVDVDNKGVFAGFTNEATFAAAFAMEVGYLTNDMLHDYQNFQSSGMVVRRERLMECGLFKENFKLTFVYEFLLRLTYNSLKIMTIPKIGYKHQNMREGSIFWNYKFGDDRVTDEEVQFWLSAAKKEYFFKNDRDIKFEPKNA